MKKILFIITILAVAWQAALAQSFEQDGIYYTILRNDFGEYVSAAVDEISADKELPSGNLVIPDSVSYEGINYPVTLIQMGAFSYINRWISVTLPTTLEEIGSSAFYKCTGLTSINFPENLVEIGNYAFAGCINLKSIHIPAKVKNIGLIKDNTYKLTAFDGCSGLESITVDENNKWFSSPDNCNAILTGDGKYFAFGSKNSTIPASVKYIMTKAFAGSDIKEVVIPESVTDIFESAFDGCSKLETVKFEGDTAYIGEYAFQKCTSLKSINLPSKTTSLSYAFIGCTSLESIVLPKGLLWFGDSFFMCTNLTSITLNENLIDVSGLYTCTKLKEIKATSLTPSNILYNAFYPEQYSTCHVIVPYASYKLYKEHQYWGQFVNLEPDQYVMGDVNLDTKVDVDDLNSIIDMILDLSDKDMLADLNHDGNIDVADINAIIDIMLAQ